MSNQMPKTFVATRSASWLAVAFMVLMALLAAAVCVGIGFSIDELRHSTITNQTAAKAKDVIEKEPIETATVLPSAPTPTPAPPTQTQPLESESVDLLEMIVTERDSVVGIWTKSENALVSDDHGFARLQIPYEVPEEYDLTMVFQRTSGNDEVALILKKNSAQQFRWVMGGWHNQILGFDMVRGKWPRENPTGRVIDSGALQNGVEYTTVVEVRNDGVRAFLQGELISKYDTDYSDMRLWNLFSLPDSRTLGVVSQGGALKVLKLELKPITGKGRPIDNARTQPGRGGKQISKNQF